jgi:hypothetical protein
LETRGREFESLIPENFILLNIKKMYKELIEKLTKEFNELNELKQKAQEQINQYTTRQVEIQ